MQLQGICYNYYNGETSCQLFIFYDDTKIFYYVDKLRVSCYFDD